MNRRQLSERIAELEGELNALLPKLPKDKNVQRALEVVAEIERLKGERLHLTRRLQQSGLLI
jgi:uncharacterized small protein (DUF1192 family)